MTARISVMLAMLMLPEAHTLIRNAPVNHFSTARPIISRARTAAVSMDAAALDQISTVVAFADQAGNLAGALFPASLPPYLLFLYFICQDVNGLSPTAKTGFTSLLLFVTATVVTSIISVKSCERLAS